MEMTSSRVNGVSVVALSGRIDHSSADALREGLAPCLADCERAFCPLVLDLADLDYMSSVGLRVFMLAAKQMKACNLRIAVAALQPIVREIFEISRFDKVFEVFPTVADAVAELKGTPR